MSMPSAERVKELVSLLAMTPLFSVLDQPHLQRLASIGQEEHFERNTYIYHEGDLGDKFYLILKGAVRISRQVPGLGEEALTILRRGAAFGEMAIIDNCPRSADALAHESCDLFFINKHIFEGLLDNDHELGYQILWKLVRELSNRLRETTNKVAFLTFTGKFQ
jgi:CRP-like cAMP-binding protein